MFLLITYYNNKIKNQIRILTGKELNKKKSLIEYEKRKKANQKIHRRLHIW